MRDCFGDVGCGLKVKRQYIGILSNLSRGVFTSIWQLDDTEHDASISKVVLYARCVGNDARFCLAQNINMLKTKRGKW